MSLDNLENRIVAVRISFDFLIQLVKLGYKVEHGIECIEGIPPDSEFVGSYINEAEQYGCLLFRHESFNPVLPGEKYPIQSIIHRATYLIRT